MTQSGTALTAFEGLRGRLFGLAYRMLGSRADAEDIVQDAYVRWHEVTKDRIDNPEAWLVTTTSRLAIDRLRRLKTEREAYVGQWLPQPIVTDAPPDRHLDLADDLSMAFLTLLERLAPEERAAFLLHDVFDVGYPEIASVIEKTESACRQVVHRARERVRGDRKRFDVSESAKETLLQRFLAAAEARDEQAVLALFAPDATWTADGGGKAAAALRPIVGADRIARLVMGLRERFWAQRTHAGDRDHQRRGWAAPPRWRSPHRDDVDRYGWGADSRGLRGGESGQARVVRAVTARPAHPSSV